MRLSRELLIAITIPLVIFAISLAVAKLPAIMLIMVLPSIVIIFAGMLYVVLGLDLADQPQKEKPKEVFCVAAMQHAKVNPNNFLLYRLTDIGLLGYERMDDPHPVIIRTSTIPRSIQYLQPFAEIQHFLGIQLRPQAIKIEIVGERGEVLCQRTVQSRWKGKRKLLILPHVFVDVDQAGQRMLDRHWLVRVYINDKRLASHKIRWSQWERTNPQDHLKEDGEIGANLKRLLKQEGELTSISLDDLLADQTIGEN